MRSKNNNKMQLVQAILDTYQPETAEDVQNALKAQRLLAETFQKAKTQIQETQDSLTHKITNDYGGLKNGHYFNY